jgi:hypothetical protein
MKGPEGQDLADLLEDGSDEHIQVRRIKEYLLTEEQKKQLYDANYDLSDVLNGRTLPDFESAVEAMFADWNAKLGRHIFGF